ncbi:MAG TPA: GNAT family protein [Pseudonocardiaceae bacterium]|nr:GNAT family protein [Pseudonocardiaceae bacterium]
MSAVARFYLRPVRRTLTARNRSAPATWRVRLGPVEVGERQVVLRSPQLSDGTDWCAIRLAERERIEPWWVSSPLSWEQRHTEAAWVSSWLGARRAARGGRALPLVVEVDGRLAGQCGLEWIDPFTGSGELGIWMDSRIGRGGFGVIATALVLDHAFGVLGMNRITAPICVGNAAPRNGCRRLGMVCEGTMASFLHVGGRRRDHDLWAITADRIPPGGLVRQLAERRVIDIRLDGRQG